MTQPCDGAASSVTLGVHDSEADEGALNCRCEVVERLLGFLQTKAEGEIDKAKALLWRCAAEGRGLGLIGSLTVAEVRAAVDEFDLWASQQRYTTPTVNVPDAGSVCSSEGSSGARVFVDGKAQVKASLRSPDGRGDKGTNSSLEPEDGETPGRRSRGQKDGKRGRTRRDKKAPAGVSENREGDQAVIPRPWGPARRNLHKELVEARHLPLLSLGLGNGTGTPVRVQLVRQLAAYLQEQPSVRRVSATRALRNAAYKGWRLAGISSLRQEEVESAIVMSLGPPVAVDVDCSRAPVASNGLLSLKDADHLQSSLHKTVVCEDQVREVSNEEHVLGSWGRVIETLRSETRREDEGGDDAVFGGGRDSRRIHESFDDSRSSGQFWSRTLYALEHRNDRVDDRWGPHHSYVESRCDEYGHGSLPHRTPHSTVRTTRPDETSKLFSDLADWRTREESHVDSWRVGSHSSAPRFRHVLAPVEESSCRQEVGTPSQLVVSSGTDWSWRRSQNCAYPSDYYNYHQSPTGHVSEHSHALQGKEFEAEMGSRSAAAANWSWRGAEKCEAGDEAGESQSKPSAPREQSVVVPEGSVSQREKCRSLVIPRDRWSGNDLGDRSELRVKDVPAEPPSAPEHMQSPTKVDKQWVEERGASSKSEVSCSPGPESSRRSSSSAIAPPEEAARAERFGWRTVLREGSSEDDLFGVHLSSELPVASDALEGPTVRESSSECTTGVHNRPVEQQLTARLSRVVREDGQRVDEARSALSGWSWKAWPSSTWNERGAQGFESFASHSMQEPFLSCSPRPDLEVSLAVDTDVTAIAQVRCPVRAEASPAVSNQWKQQSWNEGATSDTVRSSQGWWWSAASWGQGVDPTRWYSGTWNS